MCAWMPQTTVNDEALVRVVAANLSTRFPSVDAELIEARVREAMRERHKRARIHTFVGIMAERDVRTGLEQTHAQSGQAVLASAVGSSTEVSQASPSLPPEH